ncbi:hypothetical protein [Vibrio ulleungensis]|nr:hypothetical protein [Vibrio ulleungensis]
MTVVLSALTAVSRQYIAVVVIAVLKLWLSVPSLSLLQAPS